jgi:hypothetical protein
MNSAMGSGSKKANGATTFIRCELVGLARLLTMRSHSHPHYRIYGIVTATGLVGTLSTPLSSTLSTM